MSHTVILPFIKLIIEAGGSSGISGSKKERKNMEKKKRTKRRKDWKN